MDLGKITMNLLHFIPSSLKGKILLKITHACKLRPHGDSKSSQVVFSDKTSHATPE